MSPETGKVGIWEALGIAKILRMKSWRRQGRDQVSEIKVRDPPASRITGFSIGGHTAMNNGAWRCLNFSKNKYYIPAVLHTVLSHITTHSVSTGSMRLRSCVIWTYG